MRRDDIRGSTERSLAGFQLVTSTLSALKKVSEAASETSALTERSPSVFEQRAVCAGFGFVEIEYSD